MTFLELNAEELTSWRDNQYTKAFFQWLAAEAAAARDKTVQLVFECKPESARVQSGIVHALGHVLSVAKRPAPMPEVEEVEHFVDPAEPPPRRWKPTKKES
jgi:hypothetical protein